MPQSSFLAIAVAPVFVVLWSTGFIGAKLGLPYAEPITFLALRMWIVAAVLLAWLLIARRRWLTLRQACDAALIGILVHAIYLGGTFVAISWGTEAGVSALIAGLQPITTAWLARQVLGERLSGIQKIGMLLGLAGVGLVVWRKVGGGVGDWWGVASCVIGLVAITFGALLQKMRGSETPVIAGNMIQFAAAATVCSIAALFLETREIVWTGEFVFALGWLVVVLSLGAVSLYYILIRRGRASNVASLFFLIPASTAIIAYFLFHEILGPVEIAGMAVALLGVLMVNRPERVARLIGLPTNSV
ncbi:MAG: DMT family transporter [Pseudomonadota bacterium]